MIFTVGVVGFRLLPGATGSGDIGLEGEPPLANADLATESRSTPGLAPTVESDGPGEGQPLASEVSTLRTYAVASPELEGLPPDPQPGTELELWVAWEPPITKGIRFQKLLPSVTIQRVLPGLTPEEPSTVLLGIKPSEVSDLLYGDRFGSLSVVMLPAPP